MKKILAFSGSIRRDSANKKLIRLAADIAETQGASVTLVDLADYPMPIYNGDDEDAHGQPEHAHTLFKMIAEHDALMIASPEYNGLPTPLLKNTIDWISRIDVKVYSGKKAAIMSASPGGLGGMRGLPHLRTLLTNLNVWVIPQQMTLSGAYDAFDDSGALKDAKQMSQLTTVVETLVKA